MTVALIGGPRYGAPVAAGLRERKRITMMRRVQEVALDLYDEHGYAGVTIEQIADRADVSPSSVYRHFATKEGILLWNPDHEGGAADELETVEDGESMLMELRRITRTELLNESPTSEETRRRRLHYIFEEQSLRSSMAAVLEARTQVFAEVLARRTGRDPEELEVQATAGAATGAIFTALRAWHADQQSADLGDVLDATMELLQHGLPLISEADAPASSGRDRQ